MLRRIILALALAVGALGLAPSQSQATPLGPSASADVASPAKAEKAYWVYRRRYYYRPRYYRPRYYYYRPRYYRPSYYYYRPRYYRRYYW